MVVYLGKTPVGVTKIVKKEVAKTKFGLSIDNFLGDVDESGNLLTPTASSALNFSGVKNVGGFLGYRFYQNNSIISVDLSSVEVLGSYALANTFYDCTNLRSADLSSVQEVNAYGLQRTFYGSGITNVDLSSLKTVYLSGMQYTFYNCRNIVAISLSSLQTVGDSGLQYVFYGCSNLTNVDLSSLQTVSSRGLAYAFQNCSKIENLSFPSLTSASSDIFGTSTTNSAFRYCPALTEIHFRADMQATIEAMSQYANKWGATNATIYFDL